MTAVNRALMLFVPLFAFAVAGAIYTPIISLNTLSAERESEAPPSSLPPLPKWANEGLPDFSAYQGTIEKKVAFFSYLYPRIVLANSRILLEREYLTSLEHKASLTKDELKWLASQGERLRIAAAPGTDELFALLQKRLDIIPPSLILAQAANESAWGTSRFAIEGNNLFGQWCFSRGCGLVPLSRSDGANHEVAKFPSPYYSVRSYIQNLNRHPAYQMVRDIRLAHRKARKPLSGWELAEGLLGYSERGEDYIKEIRAMIRYNNLEFYDKEFTTLLGDRTRAQFERLASATPDSALLPGGSGGQMSPFEG